MNHDAGVAHVGNLENTEESDLDKLYGVNIKDAYNCMKNAVNSMKTNGGVIINMASIASSVGIADRFAYSMSKGAVLTMTYSVAKDYLGYGIRCNSISPARIHTAFVDGFIAKITLVKRMKCLTNCQIHSPSGEWVNQKR